MPATKGNKFWKARSKHGRDKIFAKPANLEAAANEYFKWVEENPLEEAFHYQGEVAKKALPKMRAMTLDGLCIFLGIGRSTWNEYREREDFSLVIEWIEMVIRDQKFTGAAAGQLNANIISRDLGLADKHDHSGTLTLEELVSESRKS